MLTFLCILNNEHDLNTIFLLELEICKFWFHYGATSIDKFSKGAVNKQSLRTAAIYARARRRRAIDCGLLNIISLIPG